MITKVRPQKAFREVPPGEDSKSTTTKGIQSAASILKFSCPSEIGLELANCVYTLYHTHISSVYNKIKSLELHQKFYVQY